MAKFKLRVTNSYYALFYQFVCVPVLAILSFLAYKHFVLSVDYSNTVLSIAVISTLVLLNICAIYLIANTLIKKFKLPLIYHVIVGAFTLVGVLWLNVYYGTVETISCTDFSAFRCVDSIINGKSAMLCLIACVYYYFAYILIHKIVQMRVKQKAIS